MKKQMNSNWMFLALIAISFASFTGCGSKTAGPASPGATQLFPNINP